MNYQKIYQNIISNAQTRLTDDNTYYEIHHIVPKCMGGINEPVNLVKLTYREHFIVHWMLTRIYDGNKSLLFAFKFMAFGNGFSKSNRLIPSSRILEENKINLVNTFSTDEHKQKVKDGWARRNNKYNKIKTTEVKIKKIYDDSLSEYLRFIQDDSNVKYVY
jgi:hypothetical protein